MTLLSIALSSLLAACGGSSSKPPPPSAVGVWSGNVVQGASTTPFASALLMDGTMRGFTNAGQAVTGTWTLAGSTVTMAFTFDAGGSAWTFTGTLTEGALAGTGTGAGSVTFSYVRPTDLGTGIWKGKYGLGTAAQTADMLVLAFPFNISELYDGATLAAVRGTGTWTLTGTTFSGAYAVGGGTPTVQVVGTIAADAMTGTFGAPPAGTSGGTMSLTRQR